VRVRRSYQEQETEVFRRGEEDFYLSTRLIIIGDRLRDRSSIIFISSAILEEVNFPA
jgi:hypothetical protein